MPDSTIGPMPNEAAAVLIKLIMREAIAAIRRLRFNHTVTAKPDAGGAMTDVCTSADKLAQEIYMQLLQRYFPKCGILAEEGEDEKKRARFAAIFPMYFTVDPLDGTKAFVREQSHGVGTMVSLIKDGRVLAAYVGDVNTQEIFGYGPDEDPPIRVIPGESSTQMRRKGRPLSDSYVLLRDPPDKYSPLARALLGNFKTYEISGGSIGIFMSRLWKDEVSAVILPKGETTPWDLMPVRGISEALGYIFFRQIWNDGWELWPLEPLRAMHTIGFNHDTLVIHEKDAQALDLL